MISIRSLVSCSPLGISSDESWERYQDGQHYIKEIDMEGSPSWGAPLPDDLKEELLSLKGSKTRYRDLDDSVLLAIMTAKKAITNAGWENSTDLGINIGSSRGATGLFEKYHSEFLSKGSTPTLTSPTTTLGNISSWVAHELQTRGPEISHSITCSTSLHAMLNAIAWLQSGMAAQFLVGGSETPLTAFTVAQMKALNIYSKLAGSAYPCRALDLNKKSNTMVLGEAASIACLELGVNEHSMAIIEGVGYATEPLEHNVSLSSDATCLQASMSMALADLDPSEIDVVVMHAPGTVKGDRSEYEAIKKVFGEDQPALTSNKWKIGHCFGASGMLSIEMAVEMLRHQKFIGIPYLKNEILPNRVERILVNAVGFGGNAVSVLLSRAGLNN